MTKLPRWTVNRKTGDQLTIEIETEIYIHGNEG